MSRRLNLDARLKRLEEARERSHPPRYKTRAERDAEWAAWLKAHPFWDKLTPDEQNFDIHLHIHAAHFPALSQAHVDAVEHYARTGERPAILDEIPHILGRDRA